MASIARDPGGRRRILFVNPDKRRKAIRLGKIPQRAAEAIKTKVEALLASKVSGCPWDNETARWVADLPDELADKLAAVGLVPVRERATLGAWLDQYILKRTDVKPGTVLAYRQARESLVECFGADKPLRFITPGNADEFRLFLKEKGYAKATVGRRIKHAKQFFSAAVRQRLIPSSPFDAAKGGTQENRERFYFVTREETGKVIDACPDAEWRLVFALSRYAGLRCPSETLRLRWADVDWERSRLTIHSPKTEHREGGDRRQVPIFPELRPHLEAVWEQAEPGSEYVIRRYRDTNINLRTALERIIYRAGLIPWPKLFQNLRSTRETELAERFPMHVVCQWIGNSAPVAAKHYLQVTNEHYEQAIRGEGGDSEPEAAQNPARYAHASDGTCPQNPGKYGALRYYTPVQVGPEGFEPPTKGL